MDTSSLAYTEITPEAIALSAVPPPRPNGGWYVGPPVPTGTPWGAIPVSPEHQKLTQDTLRSAGPPPGAITQYQAGQRVGNNTFPMPGVRRDPQTRILCTQIPTSCETPACSESLSSLWNR